MRLILPLAFSFSALCASVPALAGEIEAASRIDAVTIYPDGASVERVVEADAPAGDSRVIFRGLPPGIDLATLRVRGEGEGRVQLGAVDLKKAPAAGESAFDKQMKALREERAAAQVRIDALATKLSMTRLYGGTAPDKIGEKGLKPEDWSPAWDAVGAGMAKTGEELRAANLAGEAIDEKIKALEAARPAPAPGGAMEDVAVDFSAPAAGKIRLALTYRVARAGWIPAYEAHLTTGGKDGGPGLELARRALASQATGEDWNDVKLTLATFPTTGAASAPDVEPKVIEFYQPPAPLAAKSMSVPEGATMRARQAPALPVPAETIQAHLEAGPYQATFTAPGRVSLPSGGAAKNIALSTQAPPVELTWRISPALDPRAFLSVHYENAEAAPLLPGAVALYRDGELIGRGRLRLVAPHAGGDIGFGADERVLVKREPVRRKENEPGWFGRTKVETREFRTTVRNLHDFPVHAVVTDQTPYSENSEIVVELLPQTTPPDERDPEGKRGLLRWRFDLAPKASKDIDLAYQMKWPEDRRVIVPTP
ncbi:mucoidy inhibitor MuiA family protein [Rhodoblastus sp.]|uniref:mucoidy inhibitor MuiA family protein n=1 Tax=Rhodoblastus sp. TaxID=1962975 RepID=UPI00261D5EA1|nr:mucoidy inhibitor MuiA family protein [Rhodoblastus sp.]